LIAPAANRNLRVEERAMDVSRFLMLSLLLNAALWLFGR
jgi:hypothetical protein